MKLKLLICLLLVGCTTTRISNISYPKESARLISPRIEGATPFELWLLTYTPPMAGTFLTVLDADRCIRAMYTGRSQDVKDAAIWQLNWYNDWNAGQLTKLTGACAKLDEDNQWDLLSLMQTMFTDDFNAPTAEAYCRGWLHLMSVMKNKDDASSAADNACYYAHPVLMTHALSCFNGNIDPDYEVNGVAPYFAYYYFDSLVSAYVEEDPSTTLKRRWSQWWKLSNNKLAWMHDNSDYVAAPRKYMKNGDIHAYIFAVSNYPDCWGNIDLPGTAKDSANMEMLFKQMPNTKSVKVYRDAEASYTNFIKAWDEIIAFDSNEICFVYFSGHGATDDKGTIWYILLHDFDVNSSQSEFINTPSGRELQSLMYSAKYMKNNKLVFFISDSCLAGGLARSQDNVYKKIKSFRPAIWGEQPIIPDVYYDMAYKNLGNYILACRENQYSYDTIDGGAFTHRFSEIWSNKKFKASFDNMMKATGKQLLRDSMGMTPTMVCPKGNEKLTIYR